MARSLICWILLLASIGSPAVGKTSFTANGLPVIQVAPGEGVVMMRVIQTSAIASYLALWQRFQFHDAASGKQYEIVNPYPRTHSAYFVASIPEGDYVADQLAKDKADFSAVNYKSWGSAALSPAGGWRFHVTRGGLTNLGTLLFIRPYNQPDQPGYFSFRWVQIPEPELPARSAFFFEESARPALIESAHGWSAVPRAYSAEALTSATRMRSMYMAGPYPAAGGGYLFGELFGQVAWRHPDGLWTWEDTGAIETILLAMDSIDGTRWAAAENSTLLRRAPDGSWSRIPVPLEDASPCMLYGDVDGSLLSAWVQRGAITVTRYRPSDPAPWSTEHVLEGPSGILWLPGMFDRCRANITTRNIMLMESITRFRAPKHRVELLDLATSRWSSSTFARNGAVTITADGMLISLAGRAVNPRYEFSRDQGRTWERRANPEVLGLPVFKSDREGYVLRRDTGVEGGPGSISYWRTLDGAASWQQVTTFANPPMDMMYHLGDTTLFVSRTGLLYSSTNNGRTLTLERDSSSKRW